MTTLAALLGALPLMLGTGVGSELRHPLGLTMVGGLIVSQVLTLFTTPVIYLCFDRLERASARRTSRVSRAVNLSAALRRTPGRDDAARRSASRSPAWSAFTQLPVSPLPQVDFPTISVTAQLPGASPETMAATVATPLERALGRIAGVNEITSSSSLGSTRVTLQFDSRRDINGAAREVQAAINAARSQLPTGLPSNPDLPQGEPGRRAGHDPGAHLRHA